MIEGLIIDGKKVPVYSFSEAINIPWKECGAEYIVEATGAYVTTEKAMDHIKAGAKEGYNLCTGKGLSNADICIRRKS